MDLVPSAQTPHRTSVFALFITAIGVVFGDIGTSPLYTIKETFGGHHPLPIDRLHIMGVLSLIFWALTLIVAIKYVIVIMRADNNGEGGSLALLALLVQGVWVALIVAPLGLWSYALAPKGDAAVQAAIRAESLAAADAIVSRSAANGYRVSLTARDYVWGSNGVVANYGLQLLVANAMKPEPRYVAAARDDLYYLLGRNTFSLSWLTQVGRNPFRHPHHRPSGADANPEPWPGLLSGGPNGRKQDPAMQKLPDGLPPAKMYVDDQASYATNEIAINWNAPLVFLLAGVQ